MKKKFASFTLLLVLFLQTEILPENNQWVQYISSNNITSFAQEGNFTWIGTTGGLVKLNNVTEEFYVYTNYNSGLPLNSISCLAVDSLGNKWIGVQYAGVVKFDGSTWTVFNTQNSPLPTNDIRAIACDRNNNIWFGTYLKGLIKFDGNNWTIYNPSNSGLTCENIWDISIAADGSIWFGASTGSENVFNYTMLGCFDGTNWTDFNYDNSGIRGPILSLTIDNNGVKWMGTMYGVISFDGLNTSIYNTWNGLGTGWIKAIAIDKEGNKWAGSSHGLYKFDGVYWNWILDGEITKISSNSISKIIIGTNNGLFQLIETNWEKTKISNCDFPSNNINAIAIDSNNIKWIGSYGGGFYKLAGNNWTVYNISHLSFPSNYIHTVTVDEDGNKWIGTGTLGLAKITDNNSWTMYSSSNSIVPDQIYAFTIDKDKNKWIGGETKLVKYDNTNWTASGYQYPRICGIAIDADNNQWIATSYGGLFKFNGSMMINYTKDNSGLPTNSLTSLTIDNEGNKWVGTYDAGLVKFDGNNWEVYNTNNSDIWSNLITCIVIDNKNNKWIGTKESGLVKFDGNNWTHFYTENSGIPDYRINSVSFDKFGNIWVATMNGFCVYNESGVVEVDEEINTEFPNNFILDQNYPNPFNPSTTINFQTPKNSYANLSIYNILGQKVETLVNDYVTAGSHSVNWDAANMPSGIYVYRLEVGSFSVSKKMVLIK